MKQRQTTLLWSTAEGTECRIAPYDTDRYQLMLRWREQTIKTTLVNDWHSVSREWQRERRTARFLDSETSFTQKGSRS